MTQGKQYDANYNDALGYIQSTREKFIEPIYPLLESGNYELARLKIITVISFTKAYIIYANKQKDIKNKLDIVNQVVSKDFKKYKQENDPEMHQIKTKSISAMYDILSMIIEIMVDLRMFVVLNKRKTYEQQLGGDD